MLYLTCTMISSVDLAHYGVSRSKDWVSVDCGTIMHTGTTVIAMYEYMTLNSSVDACSVAGKIYIPNI